MSTASTATVNPDHATTLVADRLARALARHDIEVMFSQSLPTRVVLACEDIGIRQVSYRTENAGGAMADGYARMSNKLGVVCAQNGPAATLLVPPLAEAFKASIPVLAIVQEVNRSDVDRNAFQEIDHIALFQSCAKWVKRLPDGGRAEDYVDMAVVAATTGRPGPAVLLLPADILNEESDRTQSDRASAFGRWPLDPVVAAPDRISEAARLIASAEAPLVIAGGGVHGSGAAGVLAKLQELASLPVATTMMGKGSVDDAHPLSVGLIGNVMGQLSPGHYTREIVDQADLVFIVGSRTNQNGTDSWRLFPSGSRIVHLDIDGMEVGRNFDSVRLVGDIRLTLEALLSELERTDLDKRRAKRKSIESQIASCLADHRADKRQHNETTAATLRPEHVMAALDELTDAETTVVADASYASVWTTCYLAAKAPGMRFLTPRGLAGLGWGLPLAVGARLAKHDGRVVCLVGDGGFGHVWAELETLVRERIAVTLIVLNNGVLGYQKDAEIVKFGRHSGAVFFEPVDHCAIARACGCDAMAVRDLADLTATLQQAMTHDGPILVEAFVDPGAHPPLTMFDGQSRAG